MADEDRIQPFQYAAEILRPSRMNALVRAINLLLGKGRGGDAGPETFGRLPVIPLLLTSTVAGARGYYNAKRYTPPYTPNPAAKLAVAALGTEAVKSDAYVANLPEIESGAAALVLSGKVRVSGLLLNYHIDGKPVFALLSAPVATFFPVVIKWVGGSDGSSSSFASWTYNLFAPGDTVFTAALNSAGALQPQCGRARAIKSKVTKAGDGSVGSAFFDGTGTIQLWDCQEVFGSTAC